MDLTKKLFSNTFYIFLDWFFISLFGFFYWLIIGKTLPPEQYGIIITSINISNLFTGLSMMGFYFANTKLISEYLEKRNYKKIKGLIRFSFFFSFILSTFFITFLILLSFFSPSLLKIPQDAIVLSSTSIFLIVLYNLLGSIIFGYQKMRKYFLSDALGYLAKVVLLIFLIYSGFHYVGAIIAFLFSFFIAALIRFEKKFFSFSGSVDKKFVFFEYAFPAFLASLFSLIISNSQYIILTLLKNPEITGLFGVAMTISSIVPIIPNTLNLGLFPITSQLSAHKGKKRQQAYLITLVLRYSLFFGIPFTIFLICFSKPIILIFSSSKYLQASQILPIVATAAFVCGVGNIFLTSLYAAKKPKINRNISLLISGIFLLLAIILTYYYSAIGLSISYLISVSIGLILGYVYLKKFIGVKFPKEDFLKVLGGSFVFFILLLFVDLIPINLFFKTILVFFDCFVYLILLMFLKFYKEEDIRILRYVGRRMPFLQKLTSKIIGFLVKYIK